jgi:hypothetical protein
LTRYELGILGGGKIGLVPLEKPIGKGWTPYDEACDALSAKDRELDALRAELAEAVRLLDRARPYIPTVEARHLFADLNAYLSAHPATPTSASDGSKR